MTRVSSINLIDTARSEIAAGIKLDKCRACGGMREILGIVGRALPEGHPLCVEAAAWSEHLEPSRYAYLDCTYCYAMVALDALRITFPGIVIDAPLAPLETQPGWPPVAGHHAVIGVGDDRPVVIVTSASQHLMKSLEVMRPDGVCLIAMLENESTAIDRLIKNVTANPAIRAVLVAGSERNGHRSGQTLVALKKNGVDATRRVIGSEGKSPTLRHASVDEIEAFRQQVEVFDLIGNGDPAMLARFADEVAQIVRKA